MWIFKKGERVDLRGFGSFIVKERKARDARNPSTNEIVKLNHESFDRALYSEGALAAAKWLFNKKSGLYSMRDLLNFKWIIRINLK